jgi:hypothetical protein
LIEKKPSRKLRHSRCGAHEHRKQSPEDLVTNSGSSLFFWLLTTTP